MAFEETPGGGFVSAAARDWSCRATRPRRATGVRGRAGEPCVGSLSTIRGVFIGCATSGPRPAAHAPRDGVENGTLASYTA